MRSTVVLPLLLSLLASGCGSPADPLASIPDWQLDRQREALGEACAGELSPGNMTSVLAHLECEARGLGPAVLAGSVPETAWDPVFDKLWQLKDTSDFDMNRMINLLYAFGGHPAVPEALWTKLERAILDFKYWHSDSTPERTFEGEPVVDMMWYWSENHVLIFRAAEYLAGQRFPDRIFAVTGQSGAWHRARAREAILLWLEERSRWGFTEWHSDVYYNWDMQPLLSLVEWADDPEIAKRASMVLDLVWLDVALHLHRGNFGAPHGRSYIKDKPAAELQDVFRQTKLFFDDTTLPWNGGEVSFARAKRYVLPWAIRAIARDDRPLLDRERMNLPLDERPPESPDDPVAPPPYGLSWSDERYLPLWWSMSAFTAWPVLPMTFAVAERDGLWDGQLGVAGIIADLVDLDQPVEQIMRDVHPFYRSFWKVINSALLKEVHTVCYRTADYQLASIVDYRAGMISNQAHPWQATLSEHAVVFTQQPAYLPEPGEGAWDWNANDEPGPGYWTGEGSLPRIGQDRNVAVILYAPQFTPKPLGIGMFNYRDETHAYVPVAHFDELVRAGNWTFGRKDDGYFALWSHNPPEWRDGTPEVFRNGGQPFDLVAPGAQNAWVVELGSRTEWEGFEAFMTAVGSAGISAAPVADRDDDGFDDGFDVSFDSPSRGPVRFGWHGGLSVGGTEVPLRWEWRYDNPYLRTRFDDTRYEVSIDGHRLLLDFSTMTREATAAPE